MMTHDDDRPEQMGDEFARKFTDSFRKQFSGSMWGRGIFGDLIDRTVRDAAQIGEQVNATNAAKEQAAKEQGESDDATEGHDK
jgi:hypothetical protein